MTPGVVVGSNVLKPISKLATVLLLLLGPALPASAIPYAYASASAGATWNDLQSDGYASAQASDGNGSSSASISLSLGLLHASSTSTLAASPSGQAAAVVRGFDKFTVSGPAPGTIIEVTVSLHVTGTMDAIQTIFPNDSRAAIYVDLRRADSFVTPTPSAFQLGVGSSSRDPEQVEVDQVVSRTFPWPAGVPFGLSLYMLSSTQGTAISDFSHTAQLSFVLPAGASVVSDAGFQNPTLPEPSALLLLAAACAAALLRRPAAR